MAEVIIDVAKEASVQAVNTTVGTVNTNVQAVNTKVGTSGDTASNTPTTIFAGIKGLIAWFTGTWTAARAAKIDNLEAVWTSLRANYIDIMYTYVTGALYTNTARGAVKGVQRGSLEASYGATTGMSDLQIENSVKYIDVTISAVTTSKTFIIINSASGGGSYTSGVNGKLVNSTTLRLYSTHENSGYWVYFRNINWQLIEFY